MTIQQKIPLSRTLSTFAQRKALDEIAKLGLALPGTVAAVSGAIITANFEVKGLTLPQVQMPLAGPEYIRFPIQVGDKGLAIPASVYLGGVSGLGGGTATAVQRGNLATLFWMPISNTDWASVGSNVVTIYGPSGVTIRDTSAASIINLTPTEISMSCGGHTILINSAGVAIDGKLFLTHMHTLVQSGGSDSGPVA